MLRVSRKIIVVIILAINLLIGYFIFTNKAFPRLVLWNIIESGKKEDFYWKPEAAPKYFYFEKDAQALNVFRNDIKAIALEQNKDFDKIIEIGRFVDNICKEPSRGSKPIKWGSPEQILAQVKSGVTGAHCFYRSILFSTYLSSAGIESRLWAFENKRFDGISHSVTEVYVKDFNKWVMVDITQGFYVKGNDGIPLSVLEFRDKLLRNDNKDMVLINIFGNGKEIKNVPVFYRKLMICVFMRTGNDFAAKYDAGIRYGALSGLAAYLDKLPGIATRALDYVFGRRDFMMHYVDDFSGSLKKSILFYKAVFYFFIASVLFLILLPAPAFFKTIFRKTIRHK